MFFIFYQPRSGYVGLTEVLVVVLVLDVGKMFFIFIAWRKAYIRVPLDILAISTIHAAVLKISA